MTRRHIPNGAALPGRWFSIAVMLAFVTVVFLSERVYGHAGHVDHSGKIFRHTLRNTLAH